MRDENTQTQNSLKWDPFKQRNANSGHFLATGILGKQFLGSVITVEFIIYDDNGRFNLKSN